MLESTLSVVSKKAGPTDLPHSTKIARANLENQRKSNVCHIGATERPVMFLLLRRASEDGDLTEERGCIRYVTPPDPLRSERWVKVIG